MRITPLDIRKQEFRKAMRGLDPEEVHAFLATVADEYEALLNDNKALRERLLELDDKVQEYRNMEKSLRNTLLTAEKVTVEAKENARREAELIVKEAEIEAEKVLRGIKQQAMRLRGEIRELKRQRESYLARVRMLVESQLKFLDGAERDILEEENTLEALAEGEPEAEGHGRLGDAAEPARDRGKEAEPKERHPARPAEARGESAPTKPITTPASAGRESLEEERLAAAREMSLGIPAPGREQGTGEGESKRPAEREERPEDGRADASQEKADVGRGTGAEPGEVQEGEEERPDRAAGEKRAGIGAGEGAGEASQKREKKSLVPELNEIIERMVESQKKEGGSQESAGPPPPPPPPSQAKGTAGVETKEEPPRPDSPDEDEEKWSLEKLKRDILSGHAGADEEA